MNRAGESYTNLIDQFPLRPIRTDADLDHAHEIAGHLFGRLDELNEEESDYLEVLSQLIQGYEATNHPLPNEPISSVEMLKHLMGANGMKQVELSTILGVSSGRASELANGSRELSKGQIVILASHFKLSTDVFLPQATSGKTVVNKRRLARQDNRARQDKNMKATAKDRSRPVKKAN